MDEDKVRLVRRWLTRAKHDLDTARKLAAETNAYLDAGLYFCQQSAEKTIKAFLIFHDQRFEKIHDLRKLILQAAPINHQVLAWIDQIAFLTAYVSAFRYPSEEEEPTEPSREEFERALGAAQQFYLFVLSLLPKAVQP